MSLSYSKRTVSRLEAVVGDCGTLTYEPYFGLTEKPFSLNADPRFVYNSPQYAAARQGLLAGIRRREGLLVLTGEIGTGKTTLCRAVIEDLGRKTYSSLVPDPFASREDLLKMLLIDFGVLSIQDVTTGPMRQASRTELGYLLADFVESLPADAFVVVMIDEAQNLSLPLIEETRLLSDSFGAQGRLQIVFVGQPELHGKLKLPEMRQVDQRVCGYQRLAPMGRDAVEGYLQHRMKAAGCHPDRVLFPPKVVGDLQRRTGGVPRLVNRVCDRALHLAYERGAERVEQDILETALLEIGSTTLSPTWDAITFAAPPPPSPAAAPAPAAPAPALAADTYDTPALDDDERFKRQIEQWVAQDFAPTTRRLTPPPVFADDVPTAPAPERRPSPRTVPKPKTPAGKGTVTTDWPRHLRSETYLQKLFRTWAKAAAIGLALFLAVAVVVAAASVLPVMLAPPALPADPALPPAAAPAVSGNALPAAPLPEAPLPEAPPTEAAAPAAPVAAAPLVDYFVAVGLFADRDRADQIVDALAQAGLPAMQRPFQLRRQQVQQIVLGPFFSRADAVADLRRLQGLGGYADANVIDRGRDSAPQVGRDN